MVAMATTMMANTEEPILSRLDRLDNILRQLEEIKGCNTKNRTIINRSSHTHSHPHSPKTSSTSYTSTPRTSGTLSSSAELEVSPESLEKHCRPIPHVMMEADAKGTLIQRLDHVEDRVLKLCVNLEEELMMAESAAEERKREEETTVKRREKEERVEVNDTEEIMVDEIEKTQVDVIKKKKKKKGFKQLVKQCVKGY